MQRLEMPAGADPARPDPEKCERPGHHPEASADDHNRPDARDSADAAGAAETPLEAEQTRKAWATAQARCTLAGFRADMIEADDGRPMLVVSRWALTRAFTSPAEAEAWLRRVAGRPA